MKYHVCHGLNSVHFVEVPDGAGFTTGQTNDEVFDDVDKAALRAFELEYTGFERWDRLKEYESGDYAIYRGSLYKAKREVPAVGFAELPEEEDEAFLLSQTPKNDIADWAVVPGQEEATFMPAARA